MRVRNLKMRWFLCVGTCPLAACGDDSAAVQTVVLPDPSDPNAATVLDSNQPLRAELCSRAGAAGGAAAAPSPPPAGG